MFRLLRHLMSHPNCVNTDSKINLRRNVCEQKFQDLRRSKTATSP